MLKVNANAGSSCEIPETQALGSFRHSIIDIPTIIVTCSISRIAYICTHSIIPTTLRLTDQLVSVSQSTDIQRNLPRFYLHVQRLCHSITFQHHHFIPLTIYKSHKVGENAKAMLIGGFDRSDVPVRLAITILGGSAEERV